MTKRMLLAMFGVGTVLALVAAPANAQMKFAVGAGLSLPNGDLKTAFKSGFHGMAAGEFALTGAPISIRADGMYSTFSSKTSGAPSYNLISVSADAKYGFAPGPISPYILGGPTWGQVSYNSANSSAFGFNVGGGVNFGMSALKLFAEARYFSITKNGASTHWIPITVGIHF